MGLKEYINLYKTELVEYLCDSLKNFKFTCVLLLEHSKEFVKCELTAFIEYLRIENQEIPRIRGQVNANQEVGHWIISHLLYSLLEYINLHNNIFVGELLYFIKRYMTEFSISYNREIRDIAHIKQSQLTNALNLVIQQQQVEINVNKIKEKYNHYGISKTERSVIAYIIEGKSSKDIAEIMNVSIKTVEKHTSNIYDKCNLHSRIELAIFFQNN